MRKSVIAALAAMIMAGPAIAAPLKTIQPDPSCIDAAVAELKQHDIKPSMVEVVWYKTEHLTGERLRIKGFEAWADMKSCKGNVVVNLRANCQVIDTYSTGQCLFDSMKRH